MTLLDPTIHPTIHPRTDPAPHTRSPHAEEEVPEMTLIALLDTGAFGVAGGDDIPCQQEDPELWFAETPDNVEFAKALCGTCPVQRACLDGALQRREPWGVWGGQLFISGVVVARKRPRGRPRKDAAAVESADVLRARAS